jgi:hypothetical protein
MKKGIFLIFLLFISFIVGAQSQTYDKSITVNELGTFDRSFSQGNKIEISSYITRQEILTYVNYEQIKRTVTELPKYRYELILVSKSKYNGDSVKTWIYGARVFIDSVEVTFQQFPDGFTAIIETEPSAIYWYETSKETLDIKITWNNSIYAKNNY